MRHAENNHIQRVPWKGDILPTYVEQALKRRNPFSQTSLEVGSRIADLNNAHSILDELRLTSQEIHPHAETELRTSQTQLVHDVLQQIIRETHSEEPRLYSDISVHIAKLDPQLLVPSEFQSSLQIGVTAPLPTPGYSHHSPQDTEKTVSCRMLLESMWEDHQTLSHPDGLTLLSRLVNADVPIQLNNSSTQADYYFTIQKYLRKTNYQIFTFLRKNDAEPEPHEDTPENNHLLSTFERQKNMLILLELILLPEFHTFPKLHIVTQLNDDKTKLTVAELNQDMKLSEKPMTASLKRMRDEERQAFLHILEKSTLP